MSLSNISHYLEGRLFEWAMACSMVLLAVETFIWPMTLNASAFYWLTKVLPTSLIGIFLLTFGLVRCAALVANGRSLVHGPRIRAIGALAGAVMWAQFDLALIASFTVKGPPSPGIPFWFTFTFAEIYSAYRAASDVRSRSA
jgi:hypothetical protein